MRKPQNENSYLMWVTQSEPNENAQIHDAQTNQSCPFYSPNFPSQTERAIHFHFAFCGTFEAIFTTKSEHNTQTFEPLTLK